MKKKSLIIVTILIILINIFSFININKNLINNVLYDKTDIRIEFNEKFKNSISTEDFLNEIENFSEEENVEISQYAFLSENSIDIYSTNKDKYKEILLIPNLIFNKKIKTHNFTEVNNIGFKNIIYIDTTNEHTVNLFKKTFSKYVQCYENLDLKKKKYNLLLTIFIQTSLDIFTVLPLLFLAFILLLFFYYSNNKKNYLIYNLWGYSNKKIYFILNNSFYKILIITILFCNLVIGGLLYILGLKKLIWTCLFVLIIINLIILLFISLISIILFLVSFINLNSKSEKKRFLKIRLITNISKLCLLILGIIFLESFFNKTILLKAHESNLDSWKNTENIFVICQLYSPDYDTLSKEYEQNEKILKVYKDLSNKNKVFIINTLNFEHGNNFMSDDESDCNYMYNTKTEKDLYSPKGRNIIVDKNYLKRNVIETFNKKENVLDKISDDKNVLNILVPKKLSKYENDIKDSYREWFYFQKVDVTNMYKEARNENLIKEDIENLKINLIYINNNQYYFTYDMYSGDASNKIKDPIVTVYTENVDNSLLASNLSTYMFLKSENQYSALKEVSEVTQKYNINELNEILSIYDQKGEKISNIKSEIKKLILQIMIILFMLIILMFIIIYMYYKSIISKIAIQSLYGYSFFDIYKNLILFNLFIYIITFLFSIIIYQKIHSFIIIYIVLIILMDFITLRLSSRILINKSEIKLIKGESK
ncbi:hypothetical protein [Intestinibacter sp.]